MSCLDLTTKIAMMIDSLQTAKKMLNRDDIRPNMRVRLEEEIDILKVDIKDLYTDLFKIISN